MDSDTDDLANKAREHAWQWFAFHAAQRMQTFNFFLVATAFLVAAYAGLLDKRPFAALIVAVVGAWLAFWFTRLDHRNRQLVKAGEKALSLFEHALAERLQQPTLKILESVEQSERGASSYRIVIAMIQWAIFLAFVGGAIYAAAVVVVR